MYLKTDCILSQLEHFIKLELYMVKMKAFDLHLGLLYRLNRPLIIGMY